MRLAVILMLCALPLGAQHVELHPPGPGPFPFGERVVLELRLEGGAENARLGALPTVADLRIVAGSAELVDGARVWKLQVDALRPGRHRLPPIAVDDGSVTLKTEALDLMVTEQPERADELSLILRADRERAHLGELLTIEIQLRYRVAFFREFALQPFGRRLSLPVMLNAPFWAGNESLEALPYEGGRIGLVLEDEFVQGRAGPPDEEGRVEVVLLRRFRALRAGPIRLAPVVARFDFASGFEDDFLEGRRPVDRRRGRVYSKGLDLLLLEAPLAGRPSGFFGAVGRFEIATRSAVDEVEQGEIFGVDLTLRGEGNLMSLRPPELDRDLGLAGFHVFGCREIEVSGEGARSFRFEVAALDAALPGLPALEFSYFDPGAGGGYRIARSEPIRLRIRAKPGFEAPRTAPKIELRPGVDDIFGLKSGGRPGEGRPAELGARLIWFALALPVLGALLLLLYSSARERDRRDPAGARARRALGRLRRELRDPDRARDGILAEYLAAHIRRPGPALVRHDLERELREGGLRPDLAVDAAQMLTGLIDRRYGGKDARPIIDAEVLELVARVEQASKSGERRA